MQYILSGYILYLYMNLYMKSLFIILFISSFIGIAVFGFVGMHHGMQVHDGGCIAATSQGTDCPKQANPVDYAVFHLDAFKSFSLASFRESPLNVFLLAFAALFLIGFGFFPRFFLRPPHLILSQSTFRDTFFSPQKQEITHWLALHENSPSTF